VKFKRKEKMNNKRKKQEMTYDKWLILYKGKTVHDLTLNEHTKFSSQYKGWKVGNIEKVY
jgi:ribosome-interacting GTPase 1